MTARPVVVMKFGGTSVADPAGRAAVASHVREQLERGSSPVVVVSAMGRKGSPYATDTLLGLVDGMPSDARELDLLAASGEVVAAVVLAHELRAAGVAARAMTGAEAGISTDGVHGAASVTELHTGPLLAVVAGGAVPVVAGFQGVAEDGSLTTLGRGGSDTTACVLGVALGADEVLIYTDVDGVMTADPRSCQGVAVVETLGADELFQMARSGARVVHTPAAELALASGLTIRVRSTFSGHPGTAVVDVASYRPSGVATAVTHSDGIARFRVAMPAAEGTKAHMAAQTSVYRAMAEAGVSLDMFTPSGGALRFSVPEDATRSAVTVLDGLGLEYEHRAGLSKVTLVGAGMHGVPGVMAKVAELLEAIDVRILQVADSHATISVLIPSEDRSAAVTALHEGFGLA